MFTIVEGAPFDVPENKACVVTLIGAESETITDVCLSVDRKRVVCFRPSGQGDREPIALVVGPNREIRVYGGLVERDDAVAVAYLIDEDHAFDAVVR